MGSGIDVLTDLIKVTGPTIFTGPEMIVNDATRHRYLLRRFLKGYDMSELIQGSPTIRDQIMFDEQMTRRHYSPNETISWQQPQVLDEWEIRWRFVVDHFSYSDQDFELNASAGSTSLAQQYKDFYKSRLRRVYTSMLNGFEDDLFAAPNASEMESSGGKLPYSIPAFVNEFTNGLHSGWTTVQGISRVTEDRWRPVAVSYAESPSASNGPDWDLWDTLEEIHLRVYRDELPTAEQYSEGTPRPEHMFITASRQGIINIKRGLRNSNDQLLGMPGTHSDPGYMTPYFNGIPFVYVSKKDTAAVYPTGSGGALSTELDTAGTTNAGPRYEVLNTKYMKMVWHARRYMKQHDPIRHPNQPFTRVVPFDSWYNLVLRSAQRQGIAFPAADIT